jgi:hypothetical protein
MISVLVWIDMMPRVISGTSHDRKARSFLRDAKQFGVAFREILRQVSALHKTSKTAEVFMPKYPSTTLELHGHNGYNFSVDFAPDGNHCVRF